MQFKLKPWWNITLTKKILRDYYEITFIGYDSKLERWDIDPTLFLIIPMGKYPSNHVNKRLSDLGAIVADPEEAEEIYKFYYEFSTSYVGCKTCNNQKYIENFIFYIACPDCNAGDTKSYTLNDINSRKSSGENS